jgi:pyruvate dehydrogenase E1 component alpha subunit
MAKDPLCIDLALVEQLRPAIDAEIAAAVAFAEASPFPSVDDLLTHVT